MNKTELALKMNKLVHDNCKDVPHDIGLKLLEIVEKIFLEETKITFTEIILNFINWLSENSEYHIPNSKIGLYLLENPALKDHYKLDLLDRYSKFLEEEGYMDHDWRTEEPYAIDEFLKQERKNI